MLFYYFQATHSVAYVKGLNFLTQWNTKKFLKNKQYAAGSIDNQKKKKMEPDIWRFG